MRVLVADDDAGYRLILQRFLESWGHEVITAANGAEAWDLFQESDPSMILTDWMMPDMDGIELIRRIRSCHRPNYVFVILLTARSSKEDLLRGMQAGADDFIVKPVDRDELRVRIQVSERILRLEDSLLAQYRNLAEKNAQMEADLQLAYETQRALLPQVYPTFPASASADESALAFHHQYLPSGTVGGDFFDVQALSDTEAGIFICDVMGHGVRAALLTAMVRGLVEELKPLARQPGEFLAGLNRDLVAILGNTDVLMFLSAFYLVLDTDTGGIRFANAGHPSPFQVQRHDRGIAPLPLPGGKASPPVGVRTQIQYPVADANLSHGDLLVLFTDGVLDVANAEEENFGEERLAQTLLQRVQLPLPQLVDETIEELKRFSGGRGFPDDVCLLGIELRSTAE